MKNRFEYQKPDEQMIDRIFAIRLECANLDSLLTDFPMDERCRALARTKLEEVSMWANKGLVFYDGEG